LVFFHLKPSFFLFYLLKLKLNVDHLVLLDTSLDLIKLSFLQLNFSHARLDLLFDNITDFLGTPLDLVQNFLHFFLTRQFAL
jgi:hypothetical protein